MNPPIPTVSDTSAAAPATTVETTVVESQPGQVATSPVENHEDAPVETGSGIDLLRAAREEDEANRAQRLQSAKEGTAKTEQPVAPTPAASTDTPSAPAATEQPVDWQQRALSLEARLADQAVKQQQAQAQQLTQQQYKTLQASYRSLQVMEQELPSLEEEASEALRVYGQGSTEYAKAYNRWEASNNIYQGALANYNSTYDGYVRDNTKRQTDGYEAYLNSSLAPYDLSVKELRKTNPKLRLDVPGDVISASIKAATGKLTEKYEAKIAELQGQVASANERAKQARQKFDVSAAGSRMENLGDKTVGKGSSKFDMNKSSMDYFAEARAEGAA